MRRYIDLKVKFLSQYSDIIHNVIIPGDEDKVEKVLSTEFIYLKSPEVFFWKPYRVLINKNKILQILIQRRYDLVEVGSPYILPKILNSYRYDLGYKTVGFFHSNLEFAIKNFFNNKIKSEKLIQFLRKYNYNTYSEFDAVISPSYMMKRYLEDIGIKNVEVVRIGIDTSIFRPMDKISVRYKYGLDTDKIILIYVGRFSRDKGVHILVDIFNTLEYLYPNKYFLVLVGGGPFEKKLKNLIKSNNYKIFPFIEDLNVLVELYNTGDIFINCSKSDTYGISVLEAQSCGLPVFAFSGTSFEEIVFYRDFLGENKYELIKKITMFKSATIDINKLHNFVCENFSLDGGFKKLLNIYREIVKKN
ncbi:MAG: glycosyltransferase [Hydrogenothermaceae bacterium]